MHAVDNLSLDIRDEFRFILIPQIGQHLIIDEIKRKILGYVAAHHSARQRVVEQFLPLTAQSFYDQRLRIMLALLLAAARLGKMQT